jgi:hypothetical protein
MISRLKRFGVYIFVFVVLVGLVGATNYWQDIDHFVFAKFHKKEIQLNDNIAIIDIPRSVKGEKYSIDSYRQRTADLLHLISQRIDKPRGEAQVPKAVVVDMYFSSNDNSLSIIVEALKELKELTKLYVVFNPLTEDDKGLEAMVEEHAAEVYDIFGKPYLHTMIEPKMIGSVFGTKIEELTYMSEIEIASKDGTYTEFVTAIPIKLAHDLNDYEIPMMPEEFLLPFGSPNEVENQVYDFSHTGTLTSGGMISPEINFTDKVVIIGSLDHDKVGYLSQAGPSLLAWAIDDQLAGKHSETEVRAPLNKPWVLIGQIIFFSLLTAILFALFFKYIKAFQTRPIIIAALSFITGLLLLAGVFAAILAIDHVLLVGLTIIAMLITAVLAWRYSIKFLVTGVVKGSGKHDVFISYSREEAKWVKEQIYEPLTKLRKAGDKPLDIFFDEKSIGIGEAFTTKYMRGIADSRYFLPILSKGYYDRNHCRNEMELGYQRFVEKRMKYIPVALKYEDVPPEFIKDNLIIADGDSNFFEKIKKRILLPEEETKP